MKRMPDVIKFLGRKPKDRNEYRKVVRYLEIRDKAK